MNSIVFTHVTSLVVYGLTSSKHREQTEECLEAYVAWYELYLYSGFVDGDNQFLDLFFIEGSARQRGRSIQPRTNPMSAKPGSVASSLTLYEVFMQNPHSVVVSFELVPRTGESICLYDLRRHPYRLLPDSIRPFGLWAKCLYMDQHTHLSSPSSFESHLTSPDP